MGLHSGGGEARRCLCNAVTAMSVGRVGHMGRVGHVGRVGKESMGHISEVHIGHMGEGSMDNYRRSVSRWCIRSPSMTIHL